MFREPATFRWFRLDSVRDLLLSDLSIRVNSTSGNQSSAFTIPVNRFHSIENDVSVIQFCVGGARINATFLVMDNDLCSNMSIALTARTYFNTTRVYNATETTCWLFWEPGASYRVVFKCVSWPPSVCSVASNEVLATEGRATYCRSNSTCDVTLENGFVIRVEPWSHELLLNNNSAQIYLVKGPENVRDQDCCWYSVGVIRGSGLTISAELHCEQGCRAPGEPIMVAVLMITALILSLVISLVVFNLCRPNHEAYKFDEAGSESRKRRSSGNELIQPEQSPGKTPDLLMVFVD
jgi:hypothetical protein